MARVVEIEAGFVVHKLKIKCAPPRLFYMYGAIITNQVREKAAGERAFRAIPDTKGT